MNRAYLNSAWYHLNCFQRLINLVDGKFGVAKLLLLVGIYFTSFSELLNALAVCCCCCLAVVSRCTALELAKKRIGGDYHTYIAETPLTVARNM
jgi:hypothetical protein